MKKLIILFLIFPVFLMGWELVTIDLKAGTVDVDGGMCDEYAHFQVNNQLSTINAPIQDVQDALNNFKFNRDDIKFAAQLAANWWNEAGSEHHLKYDGIGDNNPEIYLRYNPAASYWMQRTWTIPGTDDWDTCIVTSGAWIKINISQWQTSHTDRTAINFITELAHEFGHLIGLAHTGDWNEYGMMQGSSAGDFRHLTEDDKHGVRWIYGRDDSLIRTTRGIKHGNEIDILGSWHYYQSGDTYRTFAKPAIVYQPNGYKGYDYIIAWVNSSTKAINYARANDSGANDLVTFGEVKTIRHPSQHGLYTYTLSAPAMSISADGRRVLVVWKAEGENYDYDEVDRLVYSVINTDNFDSDQPHTDPKFFINQHGDNLYTKGIPFIMSQGSLNDEKFILFYPERAYSNNADQLNNWNLKYAFLYKNAIESSPNIITNTLMHNGSIIKTMWNSMAGACNFPYGENDCIFFMHEAVDTVDGTGKYQLNFQRISEAILNVNESTKTLSIFRKHRYSSSKGFNFGHLTFIKGSGWSGILIRIPKAAQSNLNASSVSIWADYGNIESMNIDAEMDFINFHSMEARTGHSGVYNYRTGKYRFIWTPE